MPNFSQIGQRVFALSSKNLRGLHQPPPPTPPPVPARVNFRTFALCAGSRVMGPADSASPFIYLGNLWSNLEQNATFAAHDKICDVPMRSYNLDFVIYKKCLFGPWGGENSQIWFICFSNATVRKPFNRFRKCNSIASRINWLIGCGKPHGLCSWGVIKPPGCGKLSSSRTKTQMCSQLLKF